MTTISLVSAGSQMGVRLTDNFLTHAHYDVKYLEVSEQGIANLSQRSVSVTHQDEAIAKSDVVYLLCRMWPLVK